MISEKSCDTEVWSNDAKNSVLPSEINHILKLLTILYCTILLFLLYF